jgi:branched-chain amino acid aminotransferase
VEAEAPNVALGDRGFQLGDGVFETLRVRRAVAIDLAIHLGRLRDGLAALAIPLPFDDRELAAAIAAVVDADAPDDASVRITVTRGAMASRGTLPAGWREARPTVAIQAWPFAPPPADLVVHGIRAITATGRRDPAAPLASVKTISRADHVHAKLEAERAGADDAITLTLAGEVAEATSANVAIVARDRRVGALQLLTPPLSAGILDGTTRDWLLGPDGATAVGLAAAEATLRPDDLLRADEALLCSSVAGILPLVSLDGRPIGSGRPGPWARRLRAAREAWIVAVSGG